MDNVTPKHQYMGKEAIILAGGLGTRLRSILTDTPKPMAPVNGEPFLCHVINYLEQYGYDKITLSVGYLHKAISDYFGHSYHNVSISYAIEEEPLGTGGGIALSLAKCSNDNVVVVNGDTLFKADINALERFHHEHDATLSIVLRHVDDTSRYGSVTIGKDGQITQFTEKGNASGPGLINGGIYMLNKRLMGLPHPTRFSFEKDIMERHFTTERFYGIRSNAYFIDIGIPEDYCRAQSELKS